MNVTPAGQCSTWCVGSTLMCACPVRTPYGTGQLIYPCGTCIDDPVLTTSMFTTSMFTAHELTAREASTRPG